MKSSAAALPPQIPGAPSQTGAAEKNDKLAGLIARRRPGWSLEQDFYNDPGIFDLDMARVIGRNWLFAGLSLQAPKPGDYFTWQLGKEPLLIIRGQDGILRAWFNVCTHRGSRICSEESGNKKVLVCPYHQWAFDPEGHLKNSRHMPEGFDRSAFGLHGLQLREVGGLIFVCLAEQAPVFEEFEEGLRRHLLPYDLANAKIAEYSHFSVRANWKLVVENFRECYHCGGNHPEYCGAVISAISPDVPELAKVEESLNAEKAARWKAMGLDVQTHWFSDASWFLFWRFPLQPGFISLTRDGKPVAPLLGSLQDRDIGVLAVTTAPQFWMEMSSDHCMIIRMTPVSADVTDLDFYWLVRGDALEGNDYQVDEVTAVWKATGTQDVRLCEVNQAGVNSSAYRPGPYSQVEGGTETFVQWYLNQMQTQEYTHGR
ncbi:MAG: aromatic ring-hydroxylating dioxygenase subunit alpha [candidate division FCPU426 bacterium]